jgi:uncharacterized OB-fold protein
MSAPWDPPPFEPMRRFWDDAARGVLSAPWCDRCDRPVLYPRELCNRCHEPVPEWRELSGRGSVYAFGVEHRAWTSDPGLEAPYMVALIELEEGGRLLSNVVGPTEEVRVGTPVEVVWQAGPQGRTVPRFVVRPA